MSDTSVTDTALAPYRAVDLTDQLGGLTTRLLAGLGMDVVRVEPPSGHATRRRGPFLREEDGGTSLYWAQLNAGKRSLTLDLEDTADRQRLMRLLGTADLLFESSAPGALRRLGLGYEQVRGVAPQLIYVSITGFGQTGPKSGWAATDLIGHVSGGLSSLCGDPDRAPLRPSVEQAASLAALNAASGAMIALHARHLSGRGQHVDVSMQGAMANTLGNARLYWAMDGIVTQRAGGARAFADRATRIIYPCADGYVAFVRVPASIPALHRWMTAEGAEPRFDPEFWAGMAIAGAQTPPEAKIAELEGELEAFFAAHGAQHLYESGQAHRVMICPVNTPVDLAESVQLRAREFFAEVDDPVLGRLQTPGAPLKLSGTPWRERPAPAPGQHTEEILAELEA